MGAHRAGLRLLAQRPGHISEPLGLACCPAAPGTQVTPLPACMPIPLGSPSCCSSLDKDSPSTLCLAALERMKLSTATVALTSPDSGETHGWGRGCHHGLNHLLVTLTILSSERPGLLEPRAQLPPHRALAEGRTVNTSLPWCSSAEASGSGQAAGQRGLCTKPQAQYPQWPKGLRTRWGTHQTWHQR